MSHATDGELHAYLDGALSSVDPHRADRLRLHLARCSDCTARLEDARALHERVREILADAEPGSPEVPPFETILERQANSVSGPAEVDDAEAKGSPTPIPRRRSRPPLAWAASVAVALGAGWLAHATWSGVGVDDTAGIPSTQSPAAATGARGSQSGESRARVADLGLAGEDERRPSSEPREPVGAGSLEQFAATERSADARLGVGRQADRTEQPGLESRPDELDADAARIAAAELAVPGADRPPREEREDLTPPAQPAEAPAASIEQRLQPSLEAVQERARRAAEAGEGNETLGNVQKVAAEEAQARGDHLRDEPARDTRVSGGRVSWLTVSREDAEHWIGGSVLQVPGLAPATLAISTLGEARLVRAVQTLPGGGTLELIQQALPAQEAIRTRPAPGEARPAGGDVEVDRAQASANIVVIERDGYRITARSQVAADSLRILLSRLR